jgi:hypothetical protein
MALLGTRSSVVVSAVHGAREPVGDGVDVRKTVLSRGMSVGRREGRDENSLRTPSVKNSTFGMI